VKILMVCLIHWERCIADAAIKTGMKRLTTIVVFTLVPFAAAAQSTGVLATKRPITWGMIFALLFLMLGPIKLLGPFAAATKDCDRIFRFRLATRAFLFSVAAVTIAAALGEQMLANFAIPVLVLQIAAGLILFLVALQAVMHQYDITRPPERTEPPTLAHAFSPLAFPTIVTPYGIAAVIILISLAPTTEIRFMVAGVVYFILFLDWLAMLVAHLVVRWFNPLLLLLGVILGVNQVALGLQLMLGGMEGLIAQGVFAAPGK
jgi:multiple antibiotic resistance protein